MLRSQGRSSADQLTLFQGVRRTGQPTKFELAVNARIAKALGIAISPSVLVRANDLFE